MTGKVSNGVHSGDLRYFLLPVPSDASVVGPPEGSTLSAAQVASVYRDGSVVLNDLKELGFKGGASRNYQTGDAKYHVDVQLLHFGSSSAARTWVVGDQTMPGWKKFAIAGHPEIKADEVPIKGVSGEAGLRAIGYRGDVVYVVAVIGEPPVDHEVLIDRVRKQIARLDAGS